MPFNLITDRWLPCRRALGERVWLAPGNITSEFATDPILALDFPRPDWNAGVTELLIGLLTAAMPPENVDEWAQRWREPPEPEVLARALAPLAFAFNLDGEGPRCFQDLASLGNEKESAVAALLIDSPGDNALKKNADHFIKRNGIDGLPLAHAAAALVTVQTYSPAGGSGYRTSMRGGGPLTLLLAPHRLHPSPDVGHVTTLWDIVWSNVLDAGVVGEPIDAEASPDDERWARIFPWLTETRTSESDRATLPEDDADPLQCFFGTPRRIRLSIDGGTHGNSDLDGPVGNGIVRAFRTTNYGVMYKGWQHPLSPYYVDKSKGKLPFHPQPGLVTYEDWMAWWGLRDGVPARNIERWKERMNALAIRDGVDLAATRQRGLWAVGYDMDNMKARGFLDVRIPYFEPRSDDAEWAKRFQESVTRLVAGARESASRLQYELRRARYAKRDGDSFKLPDNAPKRAFEDVAAQLWRETETNFRDALGQLHAGDPADVTFEVRRKFHNLLRKEALRLFDDAIAIDTLAEQDAKRLVDARAALLRAFSANGKIAKALDFVEAKPPKPRKDRGKSAKRGKTT